MSNLSVQLPPDLRDQAELTAQEEGISLDVLVTRALSELFSVRDQLRYLHERAERGRLVNIDAILNKVPAGPPVPGDEISP